MGVGTGLAGTGLPLVLVPYLVMLYGIALAFAALGAYLRDLAQVVSVLVATVALFTGAVLYPRSMVPPMLAGAVAVNPISWPAVALRGVILHGQWPDLGATAGYSVAALVVLALGGALFKALRPLRRCVVMLRRSLLPSCSCAHDRCQSAACFP